MAQTTRMRIAFAVLALLPASPALAADKLPSVVVLAAGQAEIRSGLFVEY
jgi:hypothetical protein